MIKRLQMIKEFKALSAPALDAKIAQSAKELAKLKMDFAVQKGPKDVHAAYKKRKEIAILKSLKSQLAQKHV